MRCSSAVRAFAHGATGRRIVPSWGGPIELFLVPASAPRQRPWYVCNPVCGMVHIKEPLLLIGKKGARCSSVVRAFAHGAMGRQDRPLLLIGKRRSCGGSGFPLSLSEWSFTICPTPYNRKLNVLSASLNKTFPSFLLLAKFMTGSKMTTVHTTCWSLELRYLDPLSYFSFQPVLHDWCNKGRGMCYPVCGMVHIKESLLLIDKSSLCGGSGFPFSLSEGSLTICLTPYNRR